VNLLSVCSVRDKGGLAWKALEAAGSGLGDLADTVSSEAAGETCV